MIFQVDDHAASFGLELQLAIQAAKAAGQIVREGYDRSHVVDAKGVGDLVSEIDLNADRVAAEVLRGGSEAAILSEELNPELSDEYAAEHAELWIVDPLDASSAFLTRAGKEYPSVMIAKRDGDKTTLGVVYLPLLDEWYYAVRGRGAWRNGKRLICDCDLSLADVWVEMNQYGDARWETPYFEELRRRLRSAEGARLVTSNVPHSSVALRIAVGDSSLAAAVHDNHADNVKQAAWDIAAPQIILEEAGGVFLNPQGQPSDPFRAEPVIVARSQELALSILKLANRHPVDSE